MKAKPPNGAVNPCPSHEELFGRPGQKPWYLRVCTGCQNRGEVWRDALGPAISNLLPTSRVEQRRNDVLTADIFGPDGVGPGYRSVMGRLDSDGKRRPAGWRRCVPWERYDARGQPRPDRMAQVRELRARGMSWGEIADALGISRASARTYYRRGR